LNFSFVSNSNLNWSVPLCRGLTGLSMSYLQFEGLTLNIFSNARPNSGTCNGSGLRMRRRDVTRARVHASPPCRCRALNVPRSAWESARELGLRRLVRALREAASAGGAACPRRIRAPTASSSPPLRTHAEGVVVPRNNMSGCLKSLALRGPSYKWSPHLLSRLSTAVRRPPLPPLPQ
jgi:hypothetical protein